MSLVFKVRSSIEWELCFLNWITLVKASVGLFLKDAKQKFVVNIQRWFEHANSLRLRLDTDWKSSERKKSLYEIFKIVDSSISPGIRFNFCNGYSKGFDDFQFLRASSWWLNFKLVFFHHPEININIRKLVIVKKRSPTWIFS